MGCGAEVWLFAHTRVPAATLAAQPWLGSVGTRTLGEALALRSRLRPGQSVITRDGIWIGPDWLRVSRDKDAHEGVIEREERLLYCGMTRATVRLDLVVQQDNPANRRFLEP